MSAKKVKRGRKMLSRTVRTVRKRGRGQPPLGGDFAGESKMVGVRLPEEDLNRLKEVAEEEEVKQSEILRQAFHSYVLPDEMARRREEKRRWIETALAAMPDDAARHAAIDRLVAGGSLFDAEARALKKRKW